MSTKSTSPTELGEQIKHAREACGWSQKELADRAGIGKTAMFDLEHGNPGVRYNTLTAVLDILGFAVVLHPPGTASAPGPTPEMAPVPTPAADPLPEHLL